MIYAVTVGAFRQVQELLSFPPILLKAKLQLILQACKMHTKYVQL